MRINKLTILILIVILTLLAWSLIITIEFGRPEIVDGLPYDSEEMNALSLVLKDTKSTPVVDRVRAVNLAFRNYGLMKRIGYKIYTHYALLSTDSIMLAGLPRKVHTNFLLNDKGLNDIPVWLKEGGHLVDIPVWIVTWIRGDIPKDDEINQPLHGKQPLVEESDVIDATYGQYLFGFGVGAKKN